MVKIDAHHHLWHYSPETHSWINDSMQVLKRDFLAEDLKPLLDEVQFDGCVAVQASQTEQETEFLLQQSTSYPFIRGVVGWLDLRDPGFNDRLHYFGRYDKLKGLRHVVQDEPDDRFLLNADFLNGISQLADFDLTYDILIFQKHLEVANEFAAMFPEQRFVLDHIAKPDIKKGAINEWREGIEKIAEKKNVYCKLSGMVTEASWDSWEYADFVPYLNTVFDAFGPDRLMIGSDWPVCVLAGSYSQVMGIVLKYIKDLSDEDKQKVLGQNAIDFYKL